MCKWRANLNPKRCSEKTGFIAIRVAVANYWIWKFRVGFAIVKREWLVTRGFSQLKNTVKDVTQINAEFAGDETY